MYPKAIADEETIKPYIANHQAQTPGTFEISRKLITLPTHLGINKGLAKDIVYKVKENNLRVVVKRRSRIAGPRRFGKSYWGENLRPIQQWNIYSSFPCS